MRDIYCIILYIFPDIREDIGSRSRRTTFTEEVQRKHFITRRDLLNMKRKVCHLTATRHEDDAISVDYLVFYTNHNTKLFLPSLWYSANSTTPIFICNSLIGHIANLHQTRLEQVKLLA